MSILFTGDIQAEFGTLDKCEDAWNEILYICNKYKLKTIVNLGDLKDSYNPVDLRIVAWWQQSLIKATKRGLSVILLLGNHDRIGAYSNAGNWLDTLKKTSGVYVYDKPGTFSVDDIELYLLPFNNASNTRLGARQCKEMAVKSHCKTKILCFHHNLLEARYNQQGSKSHAELSVRDLFSDSYNYVIGGDVHNPQQIGKNTYYVGNPFCESWGDCNQRKRYLIVGKKLRSINSKIPRWYDPTVDGFEKSKPSTWSGARVRIGVPCDASQDYGRRLEKARRRAEKKYRGAEIYVIPKFREHSDRERSRINISDTDTSKITQYVLERSAGRRIERQRRIIKYMLKVLSQFEGGLRQSNKVKFLSAKGINFLSFKKVELDLTTKGITLVQGINLDRNSKSNGAGKTSLVQQIPVALFGKSFKDQKSDSWANRWKPKEHASATVSIQTQEKTIKIIRGRRPPQLRMYVDGKEVSSGMKSNDRTGTQQQIEKITGFTWQTLANAVYIDRVVADAFLSGTNKQRTDVLSRFQNLERFEKALEQVKKDIQRNVSKVSSLNERINIIRSAIKHTKRSIEDLKEVSNQQLKEITSKWKVANSTYVKWIKKNKSKIAEIQGRIALWEKVTSILGSKLSKLLSKKSTSEYKVGRINDSINKALDVTASKECPTCYQPVNKKWFKKYLESLKIKRNVRLSELKAFESEYDLTKKRLDIALNKVEDYEEKLSKIKTTKNNLSTSTDQLHRQCTELQRKQQSSTPVSKAKKRLKRLKRKKERLKTKLRHYEKRYKIYKYAAEAFSRDGIPAFLNRQLCPVLNKAAAYYAELFSDSEVQVQFGVEKGEFVPKIINVKGGQEINDQSTGERALAGLIASFALREVAPSCNLLILDEPGEGLDEQTAKQFARSLRKLVHRFKAIFVVTHNVHILSELSNERTLVVRKKNKISRLEVRME